MSPRSATSYVRARQNGREFYALLEDGGNLRVCEGSSLSSLRVTQERVALCEARLLPPCRPSAFVCLWNNSRSQIEKMARETPREPLYFLKPAGSTATGGDTIAYPHGETERVVLEGELGIVIGRDCHAAGLDEARDCIFGYTVVNDVTAQDIVQRDPSFPQYTRAKGFDGFGIFGPAIVPAAEVDLSRLRIQSFINGRMCQDYPASDLVFDPVRIVSELSRSMTLREMDVIACGTSLGAAVIAPGDSFEIHIEGVGSLVNTIL